MAWYVVSNENKDITSIFISMKTKRLKEPANRTWLLNKKWLILITFMKNN